MKTTRIPISANYNTRSGETITDTSCGIVGVGVVGLMVVGKPISATVKDGALINCLVETMENSSSKYPRRYLVKRPGFAVHTTPAAGQAGYAILVWTGNGDGTKVISAFGSTSTIYDGITSLGAITGQCTGITETTIGNNVSTICMSSNDQSGWYMPSNATSIAFNGTPVSGNAVITVIASTTGLYTGQKVTGNGVPTNTRILTVDSATQITLTNAMTEQSNIAFNAALAAQTAIVAGLTFTATAAETSTRMAAAFASLANGATTGGGSTYGAYSGTLAGWTSGANTTNNVLFTSVTASTDVADITCTGTAGGTVTTNPVTSITPEKLAKIIDVDFPGNAGYTLTGSFVHIDGFASIMTTDGKLWASELNTLSSWVASSYDSANAYPDKGIGCIRFKNLIAAFGSESVQFFYNAGSTPFPFAKSTAMTLKIGAINADSICQLSDNVFFAGSTSQGGLSIYNFNGNITRISTPEIDDFLIKNGTLTITLTTIRFYGRSFVLVNVASYSLAYCLEEKNWHEWAGLNKLWYKCVGASVGATLRNYSISNSVTGGKVYKMDTSAYTYLDDGVIISSRVVFPNSDFGTNKKKICSSIDVIGDTETTTSSMSISYSDDDYQSSKTLGTVDMTSQRKRLTRAGGFRKRAHIISHESNAKFRLEALELVLEGGIS